nr:hypothetical protein [Streptomyces milbemycinicus]
MTALRAHLRRRDALEQGQGPFDRTLRPGQVRGGEEDDGEVGQHVRAQEPHVGRVLDGLGQGEHLAVHGARGREVGGHVVLVGQGEAAVERLPVQLRRPLDL